MKILVSGATGFVGSALTYYLKRKGHQIIKLVRRASLEPDVREVLWNVEKQQLNPADLQDIDAVIHLAGENLAGRWTEERKQKILNSRVQGTQLIANTLAQMEKPPHVMLCASAVGYYGNRGDTRLTEVSGPGEGFLADVCRRWEAATQPAAEKGVRVVNTRFGLIMHPEGGVLKALYWPFLIGVAGAVGNGKQYLSWVALEDVLGAIEFILRNGNLRGPVNVTAPNPVTNAEFADALRKALIPSCLPTHYWTPPAPVWAMKMLLGQMAEETLLASTRVYPVRLEEAGYQFQHPEIRETLGSMY